MIKAKEYQFNMRPIPNRYRKQANDMPFYKRCCCGCNQSPVQWHHTCYYKKAQIPEIFLPTFKDCHDDPKKKLYFEWIAINMYINYLIINYPKRDWRQRQNYLNGIYGECNIKGGIEM
jgi:hypothetical protein